MEIILSVLQHAMLMTYAGHSGPRICMRACLLVWCMYCAPFGTVDGHYHYLMFK